MTFEQRSTPAPAEPAPITAPQTGTAGPTPVQMRLQILSTEHWSLLASRSLAWNESFSRAGMFLSTLSGSIVALGLIGGVDGFGDAFFVFALVILPVVLFVGIGTWIRMGAANYHDAVTVQGMNRIRAGYLEIAPDLERFFVMGTHDDPAGIRITMAVPPGMPTLFHLIGATPFLVSVLNAVVAGAFAALIALRIFRLDGALVLLAALAGALVVMIIETAVGTRNIRTGQLQTRSEFPTQADGERRSG